MSAEEGYNVTLHVYDLSQGLARQLSASFLGKVIEAIWHTGVVVYGNEYYFGGGIQHASVGTTQYGTPMKVVNLGTTHIPKDVFEMYLQEISPRYTAETYNLLKHNCNNFSNEVAQFLVGATIPDYILQLPHEVMNSPMGPLILPMIQQLETTMKSGAVPQVPQFISPLTAPPSQSSTQIPKLPTKAPIAQASVKSEQVPAKIKESEKSNHTVPPAGDPLGNARSKIQEEINKEFASLMASGTLRAGDAAALATKKVMQRYGHLNGAMPQS